MSTNDRKRERSGFVIPETFSFDIEKREEPDLEAEMEPEVQTWVPKACEHTWVKLPEEQQTLADEDKLIWCCQSCGKITNTYSWKEP
jgi:hypothetical protein